MQSKKCLGFLVILMALLIIVTPAIGIEKIKLGGIFDMTGPVSIVGKEYATGVMDYINFINESGGVGGRPIDFIWRDAQYKISESVTAYNYLVNVEKVAAIIDWSLPEAEALLEKMKANKIPYMCIGYGARLTDPKRAPYVFMVGTDYSTQSRLLIKYAKENSKEPLRVGVIYLSVYEPEVQAIKAYCKEIGVDFVSNVTMPVSFVDLTSEMVTMKKENPNFIISIHNVGGVIQTVREARKAGMNARFGSIAWGTSELMPGLGGEMSEGTLGAQPFALWGEDVPGMKSMMEVQKKYHPDVKTQTIAYTQGWVTAMAMIEAIRKAGENPTGEKIKEAFETFRNFDTRGLSAPLTFTPADHRANMSVRIYVQEKGKLVSKGFMELERKKEWLGF